MIVRGPRKERGFTILDNDSLRDSRLSFKARGIYAFVMSQPEGYRITSTALAKVGPDGRDGVLSGLTELQQAGYLVRSKHRNPDGTFVTVSVLHEAPQVGSPDTENPDAVPPAETRESAGHTENGFSVSGEARHKSKGLQLEVLKKDSDAVATTAGSLQKGTRIPDNFAPDAAMRAWAQAKVPNVNLARETEKFCNYWRAKGGREARKLDWSATWRNWMLNADDSLQRTNGRAMTDREQSMSFLASVARGER